MKMFRAKKNGKLYKHDSRHKANERKVDLNIFADSFEKRKGRRLSKDECEVFSTAYNLGYNECKKRLNSQFISNKKS